MVSPRFGWAARTSASRSLAVGRCRSARAATSQWRWPPCQPISSSPHPQPPRQHVPPPLLGCIRSRTQPTRPCARAASSTTRTSREPSCPLATPRHACSLRSRASRMRQARTTSAPSARPRPTSRRPRAISTFPNIAGLAGRMGRSPLSTIASNSPGAMRGLTSSSRRSYSSTACLRLLTSRKAVAAASAATRLRWDRGSHHMAECTRPARTTKQRTSSRTSSVTPWASARTATRTRV